MNIFQILLYLEFFLSSFLRAEMHVNVIYAYTASSLLQATEQQKSQRLKLAPSSQSSFLQHRPTIVVTQIINWKMRLLFSNSFPIE